LQAAAAAFGAVVPVFIVAGGAFGLRRAFDLNARTLATLNIYLFIPALVFGKLSVRQLEWELFGRFAAASLIALGGMYLLMLTVAKLRGMPHDQTSAFMMTMFMNLGNFGLPVATFAFGAEEGLPLAVVVMVCGSFLQNSVGVYFAQRSQHNAAHAFLRVFKFPMIYAFVLALVFQRMDWALPGALSKAVQITADAAIPVQLMILGIKIAETRLHRDADVFSAVGLRLLAGPLVAAGAALLVGLEGLPLKVFIIQLSGPVAVGMAVYGVQFDVKPGYLASVVAWSFVFSIVTVSLVLSILYTI
jgi:hypothetical protein